MRLWHTHPEAECQWRRNVGPLGRSKTVPPGVFMFSEKVRANWPVEMSAPMVEGNALQTGGAAEDRQEGLDATYSS